MCSSDLKHLESFSEKLPKDSVAVHIRRGDFLKGGCCLAVEYYKNATERILREVSDPHFIIFSDDPKWVKNSFLSIFNNKNMVVSDAIEVIDDDLINIFAIASCEHQIISNSSYSWWGGVLNTHRDKIVIAPVPDYLRNTDYYPDEWIKIPARLQI